MEDCGITRTVEEHAPGTTVLTVSGPMTVARAEELAVALREAMAGAERLELDAGGVTEIDLAGLQLLLAAGKSAAAAGGYFGVRDSGAGVLAAAAEAAGFSRHQAWSEMMVRSTTCERSA